MENEMNDWPFQTNELMTILEFARLVIVEDKTYLEAVSEMDENPVRMDEIHDKLRMWAQSSWSHQQPMDDLQLHDYRNSLARALAVASGGVVQEHTDTINTWMRMGRALYPNNDPDLLRDTVRVTQAWDAYAYYTSNLYGVPVMPSAKGFFELIASIMDNFGAWATLLGTSEAALLEINETGGRA
jgi:hypothetical protein